ncbi:MAG: response regulator transcription factor [Oscillospiraceae bacterium]|nr:response regulator transcription factor [Oscillospiraceae bacterium]MCD7934915.1 response regulator transcription factor [Oscillospiraceae bacterium]
MKLLVVDDEKLLVKGLKFNLENDGYEVDVCYDGASAVEKAETGQYDLILLDLMMPVMDGLEACMHIREKSTVPIIMLTARGEDTDKLVGFDYGADDYITKPFNILEVKARIKALLRRSAPADEAKGLHGRLTLGDITLDAERRVAYRDGQEIDLTVKEFDLVSLLMRNNGRVFSRETLLNIVWGTDYLGEERTVDVHIRRLREKLERNPAQPEHIITKWGVGYYFKG